MTRGQRTTLLATVVGLGLALSPAPAAAHPLTGGPATPGQIVVTVVGLALVVAGGVGAFSTAGTSPPHGLARIGKAIGVPALLVGLVTVFVGPDAVTRVNSRCSVRPSSRASLRIASPTEGQVLRSSAVPLRVELAGGALADGRVNRMQPGKGHLQVSVDRILVTQAANAVQVLQMGDGAHRIVVEYVAGDHLPFCPKVTATRNVKVQT